MESVAQLEQMPEAHNTAMVKYSVGECITGEMFAMLLKRYQIWGLASQELRTFIEQELVQLDSQGRYTFRLERCSDSKELADFALALSCKIQAYQAVTSIGKRMPSITQTIFSGHAERDAFVNHKDPASVLRTLLNSGVEHLDAIVTAENSKAKDYDWDGKAKLLAGMSAENPYSGLTVEVTVTVKTERFEDWFSEGHVDGVKIRYIPSVSSSLSM